MPFIPAFPGAQYVSEECGGGGAMVASVYERRCRKVPVGHAGGIEGVVKPGWVSGGGGSVSMRDRNTVESDVQKSEKGRQHKESGSHDKSKSKCTE